MQGFSYGIELIVTHQHDPIKPTQMEGNVCCDDDNPPPWSTELECAQAMLNAGILHMVSLLQKIKAEDPAGFEKTLRRALRRIRSSALENPSDIGFKHEGRFTEDDLKDLNI